MSTVAGKIRKNLEDTERYSLHADEELTKAKEAFDEAKDYYDRLQAEKKQWAEALGAVE